MVRTKGLAGVTVELKDKLRQKHEFQAVQGGEFPGPKTRPAWMSCLRGHLPASEQKGPAPCLFLY